MRKALVVRLDPEIGAGFESLSTALGVNQTALIQASVERWVARWKQAGEDVATWEALYQERVLAHSAVTLWEDWVVRAREIEKARKARPQRI